MFDSTNGSRDYLKGEKSYIDLQKSNFSNSNLDNIELVNANLHCSNLNGTSISQSFLTGAVLSYVDMQNSKLSGAKLKNSEIQWCNMHGATLNGELNGATIIFSDLRSISTGFKYNPQNKTERQEEVRRLAKMLGKAKSLYETLLDPDLEKELLKHNKIGANGYQVNILTNITPLLEGLQNEKQMNALRSHYETMKTKTNEWKTKWESLREQYCKSVQEG